MRMLLENYLELDGNTIDGLAYKLGRSRETIRRWRDNALMDSVVIFDPKTDEVERLELGQIKIIEAKS